MNRTAAYAAAAFAAVAVVSVATRASARPKIGAPPAGYAELDALAKQVDPYIPGFSGFARAAAYGESRGNIQAVFEGDAGAACRGYERKRDTLFANNPHPAADFCWGSGGWFGFIPSTALAAPGFEDLDPYLIFDPEASVAMFSGFVARIVRNWWGKIPESHRNWLTIRRFMAGNTVGLDWNEEKVLSSDTDGVPRSVKVRQRLAKAMRAVNVPPSLMYQRVRLRDYPGAMAIWNILESDVV